MRDDIQTEKIIAQNIYYNIKKQLKDRHLKSLIS